MKVMKRLNLKMHIGINSYHYNFSKDDIQNQFSIRYDSQLGNTYVSLSTDNFTKEDLVVLNNGIFELSHFS